MLFIKQRRGNQHHPTTVARFDHIVRIASSWKKVEVGRLERLRWFFTCVGVALLFTSLGWWFAKTEDREQPESLSLSIRTIVAALGRADVHTRVSILDFEGFAGERTELAGAVSDMVVEAIFKSGRFRIVDSATDAVVRQQLEEAMAGWAGSATAVRVGKLLQPEGLLYGRVGVIDNSGLLLLTMVSAETKEIIYKDSVRFLVTRDIRRLDSTEAGLGEGSSKTSRWGLFKGFLVSNWPWLWTVILVPAAAWLNGRASKEVRKEGG